MRNLERFAYAITDASTRVSTTRKKEFRTTSDKGSPYKFCDRKPNSMFYPFQRNQSFLQPSLLIALAFFQKYFWINLRGRCKNTKGGTLSDRMISPTKQHVAEKLDIGTSTQRISLHLMAKYGALFLKKAASGVSVRL